MRRLAIVTVVVLAGGFAAAQDALRVRVPAAAVEARTQRVMEVYGWSRSVEDLKQRAAESGKLMFWMQIVGKLDDGL